MGVYFVQAIPPIPSHKTGKDVYPHPLPPLFTPIRGMDTLLPLFFILW